MPSHPSSQAKESPAAIIPPPYRQPRWFPTGPQEFLLATRDLNAWQTAALMVLAAVAHERENGVPDDPAWLATLIGCRQSIWLRIRAELLAAGRIRLDAHTRLLTVTPPTQARRARS